MDEVELEVLDLGGELREAVEVVHRGLPIVVLDPVLAEAAQVVRVAAVGPAVRDLRGGRPGIVGHLVQHGADLGFLPADFEALGLAHGWALLKPTLDV